jgi:hypothetical protein
MTARGKAAAKRRAVHMKTFSASLRSSSSSTSAIRRARLSLVCTSGLSASRFGLAGRATTGAGTSGTSCRAGAAMIGGGGSGCDVRELVAAVAAAVESAAAAADEEEAATLTLASVEPPPVPALLPVATLRECEWACGWACGFAYGFACVPDGWWW